MRTLAVIAALIIASSAKADDTRDFQGMEMPQTVPFCLDETMGRYRPCSSDTPYPTMSLPFQRMAAPFVLDATVTPQQYIVTQPLNTRSYRGFNPCTTADVRILSVKSTAPLVTEPTPYPGVRKVTSSTEKVTPYTGTRIARGAEVLGSFPNPNGGQDRIISIMLAPIPDYPGDMTTLNCLFEIGYGNGGGS